LLAELLFVAGLAVGHGLLSGAETAILEVKPSRVRELIARGVPGGKELEALRARPERMLSTTRSTMALLAALAGVGGGLALARDLAPAIVGVPLLARVPRLGAGGLAVGIVALSFVTLGHLVPQALGAANPHAWAAPAARLVSVLARFVHPLAWIATGLSNLLVKPFGASASFSEPMLSEAALHESIVEAAKVGTLDPRPSIAIQKTAEGTLIVDGAVPVRDVNRELEVELPESDDWSTVAGLCIALAGRIPQAGERIRSEDGTELEILSASNQRVRSVRVSRVR